MPASDLLKDQWLGVPVPVWAGGGLAAAYWWSKRQAAAQAANATPATTGTSPGEPNAVAPAFIIENNLPATGYGAPSAPVPTAPSSPGTVTPPGTSPTPPVTPPAPLPAPTQPTTPVRAGSKAPLKYRVVSGDDLSKIAARYHTTWQALWAYNTTPGNRSAVDIATLRQRGPDLLYAGETILIPQ